jgi:hypothetical protein
VKVLTLTRRFLVGGVSASESSERDDSSSMVALLVLKVFRVRFVVCTLIREGVWDGEPRTSSSCEESAAIFLFLEPRPLDLPDTFWICSTTAEVRPPTVIHLILACSPDGWTYER